MSLLNSFKFKHNLTPTIVFEATRRGDEFVIDWNDEESPRTQEITYTIDEAELFIAEGYWEIQQEEK